MSPAKHAALDLPEPRLLQAVGSSLDPSVVPPEGTPVEVRYDDMRTTDLIQLCWPGLPPDEEFAPIAPQYGSLDGQVTFIVPYDYVGYWVDGVVSVFYNMTRDDEVTPSATATVNITWPRPLPEPVVEQAIEATLYTSALPGDEFTFRVPRWPFINRLNRVWLDCHVTPPDGQRFTLYPIVGELLTAEDVEDGWVRHFSTRLLADAPAGSRLLWIFRVAFRGQNEAGLPRLFPSLSLLLNRDPLPMPEVLEAPDGLLDLGSVDGNPHCSVAAWPFARSGQPMWLHVTGVRSDGTPYRFDVLRGEPYSPPLPSLENLVVPLPRQELEQLRDDSEFELHFAVNRHGPADEGSAIRFPIGVVQLCQALPELIAPSVLEAVDSVLNPVNAQDGATLRVAYAGMHEGQMIQPFWNGEPGPGSPSLAPLPASLDGYVDFAVPASAVAANLGRRVTLVYEVTVRGQVLVSPQRLLQVLELEGLPTPQVTEATDAVLDLNTFDGDAQATVQPWPFIVRDQACWLWVTGQTEDGTPVEFGVLEGEPLPAGGVDEGAIASVSRRALQGLADCSRIEVRFAVNFDGRVDYMTAVKFPTLSLHLVQEALDLPAPSVLEAVGATLTPWNAREGATVRVEYPRINRNQLIEVFWQRPDGGYVPIAPSPGNEVPGHVDFQVPRDAVIAAMGKTVPIRYSVTSPCQQAVSALLELKVLYPTRLPTPVVAQATAGILDLRTFAGDADIRVESWWFILPGQRVWLRGVGTLSNGGYGSIDVIVGERVTANEVSRGLHRLLRRAQLAQLRDFSRLTFTCKVTVDGSSRESEAIAFPSLSLTVRQPFYDLTNFVNSNWNGWVKGPAAADPRDLVIRESNGEWFLFNYTYTNNSAGVILRKSFTLEPGHLYEFDVEAQRASDVPEVPSLSTRAGGVLLAGPVSVVSSTSWIHIKGTFSPRTKDVTLEIHSHVAARQGNDYKLKHFLVRELY